ncbi:MAG: sigma-70 family RNA polymerase sigma factor [Chloroflexi bacterium]|nr:sigma-70 family RNA polymerase sigma factor [Chloroflexota bacterium]
MPDTTNADEQTLIQAAQRGSLKAFNVLVLRYQDVLYSLTYRIMGDAPSASDATQEAFIAAYRQIKSYRGGSFRAWLLRIATNSSYDELRRRKRRPAIAFEDLAPSDSDDEPPVPDSAATPEQALQDRELNRAIQDCINGLVEDQRVTLVLSDIEGLSYQEIADHTNAQIGTVKSRLSRARASIRHCLQAVQELLPGAYRLMQ